MRHVLNEGKVGLGLRSEFAVGAEPVVIFMNHAGRPLGGERGIGDDGLETQVGMLGRGILQSVFIPQIEALVVDAVQDHVHPREVVSRGIHLLPVEVADFLDLFCHSQGGGSRNRRWDRRRF